MYFCTTTIVIVHKMGKKAHMDKIQGSCPELKGLLDKRKSQSFGICNWLEHFFLILFFGVLDFSLYLSIQFYAMLQLF